MIFDSLKNSALYYSVHPRLEKAFGYIASTDWEKIEPGIHELDGKDIYVNVMERELKKPVDAKLEIHNEYIDIQVLVRGEKEAFGWSERADVHKPLGEFDAQKDIQLFDDVPQTYYSLRPGQFTILMPEDAHAPMVGEGSVRKIIVKVRI
ncbi:YhcH/YjgK/YiaL family protein [uncultured Alistipes sp.]|jgi:YhcH/YjgK/YiaL family protein|uniref:YhcH/YjgK/YiaL family protein n=1 Tax=uncultured Alistipes sp. TaxID=538949 RepID=UPI0025F8B77E|nr:YhcH/YjgK/YiaL family protein [uncultured Alistipes sp.]